MFRSRTVHAIVRVPAGFSAATDTFFREAADGNLGDQRIEWTTSPTLDASYRWLSNPASR